MWTIILLYILPYVLILLWYLGNNYNLEEEDSSNCHSISNIVTNNPLESLANFARTIENPNATLELDF